MTLIKLARVAFRRWLLGHSLASQDVIPAYVEKGGRAGGIINWRP